MLLTHIRIRNSTTKFNGMNFCFYNEGYVFPIRDKCVLAIWYDFGEEVSKIAPNWAELLSKERVSLPEKQYFIPIDVFAKYADVDSQELYSLKIGDSCQIKEYKVIKVSEALIIAEY